MKRVPFVGRKVWHHGPIVVTAFTVMAVALATSVNLPQEDGAVVTLAERLAYTVIPLLGVWTLIVRPRIALSGDEVAVVQWRRTVRFPVNALVEVGFDYYGSDLRLDDGRVVRATTLQRPNWAAWTGRPSRTDRIAYELRCHAALMRGEDFPKPPGSRRSNGDLPEGFLAGLGAALRAMLNSTSGKRRL